MLNCLYVVMACRNKLSADLVILFVLVHIFIYNCINKDLSKMSGSLNGTIMLVYCVCIYAYYIIVPACERDCELGC